MALVRLIDLFAHRFLCV